MLRGSLHAWDFDVIETDNGEDGLTLVANHGPDFVILDLSLPGIDGIETLRHLRSFTDVPVLVLTVRDGLQARSPRSSRVPTTTWSSRSSLTNCWRAASSPTPITLHRHANRRS